MKSALAVTEISDDSSAAAADLVKQIKSKLVLQKNSCGILFAEVGYEAQELLPVLHKELGIEIIGGSATAQITNRGYHRMAASLLVLTSDDCHFAMALTEPFSDNYEEKITAAFKEAEKKLEGEPLEAVFLFSCTSKDSTTDDFLVVLNRLAGGKPIFGAVASDYFEFSEETIFFNDQEFQERMAIMLISGNFRPKFIIRNVPRTRLAKSIVTESKGASVQKIDNMTVYEYLKKNGVDPENPIALSFAPLSVEYDHELENDGEPICRPFFLVDKETGAGFAHGAIPEGATVSIRIIESKDILSSTKEAMETICKEIAEDESKDYEYSTVLGVTCAARHIVLGPEYFKEGEFAQDVFPQNINFAAFYSFGEYCPTSIKNDKAVNRAHNLSIGLCAF